MHIFLFFTKKKLEEIPHCVFDIGSNFPPIDDTRTKKMTKTSTNTQLDSQFFKDNKTNRKSKLET